MWHCLSPPTVVTPHELGAPADVLCSVPPRDSHCTCPGMLNKTSSNHSEILNRNTVALRDRLVRRGEKWRRWAMGRGKAEKGEEKVEKTGGKIWIPAKDGMQLDRDEKADGRWAVCAGLFFWGRADSPSTRRRIDGTAFLRGGCCSTNILRQEHSLPCEMSPKQPLTDLGSVCSSSQVGTSPEGALWGLSKPE